MFRSIIIFLILTVQPMALAMKTCELFGLSGPTLELATAVRALNAHEHYRGSFMSRDGKLKIILLEKSTLSQKSAKDTANVLLKSQPRYWTPAKQAGICIGLVCSLLAHGFYPEARGLTTPMIAGALASIGAFTLQGAPKIHQYIIMDDLRFLPEKAGVFVLVGNSKTLTRNLRESYFAQIAYPFEQNRESPPASGVEQTMQAVWLLMADTLKPGDFNRKNVGHYIVAHASELEARYLQFAKDDVSPVERAEIFSEKLEAAGIPKFLPPLPQPSDHLSQQYWEYLFGMIEWCRYEFLFKQFGFQDR